MASDAATLPPPIFRRIDCWIKASNFWCSASNRTAKVLYTGVQYRTMSIRPARFEDAAFVYALSQEPSVLKWRVKQGSWGFDQHMDWWIRSYYHDAYLVAEDVTTRQVLPIGYLRLTEHLGVEEVSIAVHPDARRRGVGAALLNMIGSDSGKHFAGLILPDNEPSIRLFEKCGYQKTGTEMRENREWLVYVK